MKFFWLLVPLGLFVSLGCGHENQPGGEQSVAAAPGTVTVGKPGPDTRTSLVLIHKGQSLSLSDSDDAVNQVFSKPKGSFEFSDLPENFQPPYRAQGWESTREGVGAIFYGKRVVAVIRQLTRSSLDQAKQIVDTTGEANGTVTRKVVSGNHVTYYFWTDNSQRIMISVMQTKHDGIHLTEALGDVTVMDALGMSEAQAAIDEKKVNALVNPTKS